MLSVLGTESFDFTEVTPTHALTFPANTKAIALLIAGGTAGEAASIGGVALTRSAPVDDAESCYYATDITGRSNDTFSITTSNGSTRRVRVLYIGGNVPVLNDTQSSSGFLAGTHTKTHTCPGEGNLLGLVNAHKHTVFSGTTDNYDGQTELYDDVGPVGSWDTYMGYLLGADGDDIVIGTVATGTNGFQTSMSTWSFYESQPDIVFTPGRIAGVAAWRAGIALVLPSAVTVYPMRLGARARWRAGVELRAAGGRQVMLTGNGLETPEMTEGGSESNVLTYHPDRKPTWEERGLTAAEVAGMLAPDYYLCDSLTATNGTVGAGSHTDLHAVGGNAVRIDEASGTPGMLVTLAYSGVDALTAWQARIRYVGSHDVHLQLYNYDTASWDTLDTFTNSADYVLHSGVIADGAPYFDGGGNAQLRFYHDAAGNPSHDLFIDYAVIGHVTGGSGALALDDLTDVDAAAPGDGDALVWDDGAGAWVPGPAGASALDDLSDVDAPAPTEGQFLKWDDASGTWVAADPASDTDVQVFTSDGTWTKPTGDYARVRFLLIGGGGGGGSGRKGANGSVRYGGGGGGGGGLTIIEYEYDDLDASYAVKVGTGGTGGAGSASSDVDGTAGNDGNPSYVGASAAAAIAAAGGGQGGSGGSNDEVRPLGRGGAGTSPGGQGGAGNDFGGNAAGVIQTDSNFSLDLPLAGGAGGGGGGGGKPANDSNQSGGAGGLPGILASRTAAAGGVDGASAAVAGFANTAAPMGPGPGGGGGGGAGATGNSAYRTGAAGGLYGGGGGGGGAQNNSGTTGAGGDGAAGLVVVVTYGGITPSNLIMPVTVQAAEPTPVGTGHLWYDTDDVSYVAPASYSGTSFPLAPSTYDRFFRTDIRGGMEFYYDGARWVSMQQFLMAINYFGASVSVDTPGYAAPPKDYDILLTRLDASIYMSGSSAEWRLVFGYSGHNDAVENILDQTLTRTTNGPGWISFGKALTTVLSTTGATPTVSVLRFVMKEISGTNTSIVVASLAYRLIAT